MTKAKARGRTAPAESFQVEMVPIDRLRPDPHNAREHSERNVEAVAASLREFGWRQAIVARKRGRMILAGHARVEAAKLLGLTKVPVLWVTDSDSRAAAFAIADNRTSELATWNMPELAAQLAAINDAELLGVTGFTDDELNDVISAAMGDEDDDDGEPDDEQDDGAPTVREVPTPKPAKKAKTKLGDVIRMGPHRLVCGDSSDDAVLAACMGEERAQLVFADPPYGVSYQSNGRTEKFGHIIGDGAPSGEWLPPALQRSDGWLLVWCSWKVCAPWLAIVGAHHEPTNLIVWHKASGGLGDLKKAFATDYELAIACNRGAALRGRRTGSVWKIRPDSPNAYVHPTQKPVALAAHAIHKTTEIGAAVLDPFLGSGSTLLACEQMDRRCFGVELDPAYCDVIVQRWENLTGMKAER